MLVFGTRPEAIKMAPIFRRLLHTPGVVPQVCVTAQHRQMLDQVLELFGIRADHDLDVMRNSQGLTYITTTVLERMAEVFAAARPDRVLVQGDTTTTFAAALAAFYARIPVGHVEAGLRTWNIHSPWPEEMNRKLTSAIADLHFPPTEQARDNLLREGIDPARVHVTGNTVIDALKSVHAPATPWFLARAEGRRVIGVTLHRRESWGGALDNVMQAITSLRDAFEDVEIVFVRHANPALAGRVERSLSGEARITVVDPLDYPEFVALLRASFLMLSDSGGVQEEAPAFGTPVLVLRNTTERPEAVAAGTARLVGVETAAILREAGRLLADPAAHAAMARALNPFGDGRASERITGLIEHRFAQVAEAPRAEALV